MTRKATLGKTSFILAVLAVGGLMIVVSRNEFAVSGVSGANAIFRVHVYAQVLALLLVIIAAYGWLFLFDHAPAWVVFVLTLAVSCYVMSMHNLIASWTTHELIDQYWPVYSRRLSTVPSDVGLLGVTCRKAAFIAHFVNEKKESMSIFLGIYPWRIDWDGFDEFFHCEERK